MQVSVLAAAQEPGAVSGMCLLDPADGGYDSLDPQRYPSALPIMAQLRPPVLLVGAGRGGDCVPRAKGSAAFLDACRSPCVQASGGVAVRGAGALPPPLTIPPCSRATAACPDAVGAAVPQLLLLLAPSLLLCCCRRSSCRMPATWRGWTG